MINVFFKIQARCKSQRFSRSIICTHLVSIPLTDLLISLIVYLLETFVRFIHVLISSFKSSAAPVQDLSEQLTQLQYLVQLPRSLRSFHYLLNCFLDYHSCSRSFCYSGCSYNLGCSYCVLSFFFNYWSCSSSLCSVSCTYDLSYSGSCTCNPSCSPAVPKGSAMLAVLTLLSAPGAVHRVSATLAVLIIRDARKAVPRVWHYEMLQFNSI